jgi:NAD(P)-dependent dehydrogenase (short-subunit alcohol dehydrogenase family)
LRDHLDEVRDGGADLIIVGNGSARFAAAFRQEFHLDVPGVVLLTDPDLVAYRAAGMRRGRVELLSPRVPLHAVRAFWKGARQGSVQGDPWQLGGVLVVRPGGALTYRYVSREAGDHPPVGAVLDALDAGAPPVAEEPTTSALQQVIGRGLGLLIDPTIVLSFDRTGFWIHSLAFRPSDLDVDLAGRRMLISGGNSGIGYEAALALADLGAEVVLLCRNVGRGEAAAHRIREATGNARVAVEAVDVSRLASVRAAAARLRDRPVDVLIHNAGVLPERRIETEDGLELTVATHVVGPFVLTQLLRGALEASTKGRVIWVSSGGMYTQRLNLADIHWRARPYDGVRAYAETKRAQVVLSELWAEELAGTEVVSNAMHPGWADTPGVRSSIPTFHRITRSILRTPAEGADTIVWLAASERAGRSSGRFFFDRAPRRSHFLPTTRESADDRRALWRLCREGLEGGIPNRGRRSA